LPVQEIVLHVTALRLALTTCQPLYFPDALLVFR